MDQEKVAQAANILRNARNVVALTGAGIGRPSGIPDFRSESGLWSKDDPMEAASIYTFQNNPQRFFDWLRPLMDMMLAAEPNPAHLALVDLERKGVLTSVITQNIDGLHQRAGSNTVYELHGNIQSATCFRCGLVSPGDPLVEEIRQGTIPRCQSCGGPFKPDITLFGESLPEAAFLQSHFALEQCDVLIIAGTSLEVFPAGRLPMTAVAAGAQTIIVNLSETYMDRHASVVLREDVATGLPAIVEQLG
jgi:NAD-dependent deacetylase